jgi:AraC-like DNA-binding protein
MVYLSQSPGPPLAPLVETLWWVSDAPRHARERVLPSGTLELVINLHENEFRIYDAAQSQEPRKFPGAIVSGAYRAPFVIDTREHASILGVHFRPGGAGPLLGVPPGALANAHMALEALWGRQATELRDRLCDADTPTVRFRILERTLVACLRPSWRLHGAVPVALAQIAQPGATIRKVAGRVGLSHRRLIEVFTAEVGLTPKLFGRVRRFQTILAAVQTGAAPHWAQLALAAGYYDQAHLIGDFVEFSGLSPTELVRRRRIRVKVNHVAA